MAQPRFVGAGHADGLVGDLQAVTLGRETVVHRLDGLTIGDPAAVGCAFVEAGPGQQDRCSGHGAPSWGPRDARAQVAGSQGPSGRSP